MLQGQQVGLTLASSQLPALPQREQVSVSPAGSVPSHRGPPRTPGSIVSQELFPHKGRSLPGETHLIFS